MSKEKNSLVMISALLLIGVFVFAVVYGGITLTRNLGKSKKVVSKEKAAKTLEDLYQEITVNKVKARKEVVNLKKTDMKDTLPKITKYPVPVKNTTQEFIEIFVSPEKAGQGKDGWLVEVGQDFNQAGIKVAGREVSVKIRKIASGLGKDYIVSGKHLPDAYTPSNALWGKMIEASGQQIKLVEEKFVANTAGVLLSQTKHQQMLDKYGAINLKVITEAVAKDELAMGYTNPFASSTGLNFLLATLSGFDEQNLLSDKAVTGFEKFQSNIPFLALTTMQMRDSATSGVLDGFILEHQTYLNSPSLKSDYVFTPFGLKHNNPIYAVGDLPKQEEEILHRFVEFAKQDKYQNLASQYGFNQAKDYQVEMEEPSGKVIVQAQKLWKEKKDGNTEISAVFVADISGSMDGERLNKLKESLLTGAQYISQDHSIGLVTFSSDVNINLPIDKFDLNQRSYFAGAVEDMQAFGNTAMFDGIIVAANMLMEERKKKPNAKLMLFVLSDGNTNRGHTFNDIESMLKTLKIPIYTIGYNADIKVLQNLSSINEAASINADVDDVSYKLQNLFNAQM